MPTFVPDQTNPLDSSLISAYPANERTMRGGLKTWIEAEHSLVGGRHKLPSGTTTARNALTEKLTGMWFFNTTTFSLEIWDGAAWTVTGALSRPGFIQFCPFDPASLSPTWLQCNGASLLIATYPLLSAAIRTVFSGVDGTHFNLPDMRGRSPIGYHSGGDADGFHGTMGAQVGDNLALLAKEQIPRLDVTDAGHAHGQSSLGTAAGGNAALGATGGATGASALTGILVGDASPDPVDNRHASLVGAWIIKT